MYKTRVSSKGQMILPAGFRGEEKIGEGTEIIIEKVDGSIVLIPIPKDPAKALLGMTKGMGIKSSDIKKMRRDDDRKRAKKLGF